MIMNPLLLLIGLTFAHTDNIDTFNYPTVTEAQSAWTAKEGAPQVAIYDGKAGKALRIEAPFETKEKCQRVVIDRDVVLDLSAPASFSIDVNVAHPDSVGQISLYFHSSDGWVSAGSLISQKGWQTLRFEKPSFRAEGNPAGWHKVDRIRIAFWRQSPSEEITLHDTPILVRNLVSTWNDTAILLPDDMAASGSAYKAATTLEQMLGELGIGVDRLLESSLANGSLGKRKLVLLPMNRPSDDVCKTLEQFVEAGGKMYLQYGVPRQLQQTLGFGSGEYYAPKGDDHLASIHFDADDVAGLPPSVDQASWNITTAEPIGHNARVIGTWHDRVGRSTGKAAMLISDRGAYLSHIALNDGWAQKKQMLAAVLGNLVPEMWDQFATAQLKFAERIGHCYSGEELASAISGDLGTSGKETLRKANDSLVAARELLANGQGFRAFGSATRGRELRMEAYLKAQPSPAIEARAFWDHGGMGIYPGDWDRTCKELAEAGFNMIIPNMLWAGVAHYPSDVLPRSEKYKKYGDQIEQCVDAAKKHGLEVHIWKVCHNPGSETPPEFLKQMRAAGRTQVDNEGNATDWLNPAHPENLKLEVASLLEVIRKYDVDGIHFDYIRYPHDHLDYSEFSRKKFQSDTGVTVKKWPEDCYSGTLHDAYRDWRAEQITRTVKTVSEQAREVRPGIKISAAVFREHPSCRTGYGQDWPLWAKQGYVDFLCPMDYTEDDEQFTKWITEQQKKAGSVPVYPGIGAIASGVQLSADRVVGQIHITRELKTGGFTIFNLTENTAKTVLPGFRASAGKTPATTSHN